jgi:hypothetical protein
MVAPAYEGIGLFKIAGAHPNVEPPLRRRPCNPRLGVPNNEAYID